MAELMHRYREDPVFFVMHALGHHTWSRQREVLQSVRKNLRTAVRASHSVSKTFTAAEAACWFFNCYPESKVISTAPTQRQVKDLLWSEMGRNYRTARIRLEGECTALHVGTKNAEHFALGFSTDQPAKAEGYHAPQLMFIFDESKGIPHHVFNAAEGALTGGFWRWLVISTTDGVNPGEPYWKCFLDARTSRLWNQIHIDAHHSPYVTGEPFQYIEIPDPARPDRFKLREIKPASLQIQLATPEWIKDRKDEWGEESVLYQTKVRGALVENTDGAVIPLSAVYKMFENHDTNAVEPVGAREVGIDVARGGSDDTTMFKRKGLVVQDMRVIHSPDLPAKAKLVWLADRAAEFIGTPDHNVRVKVDDTGVGGGLTDILQDRGYNIIPVNFGQEAVDPDKYPNAISEMWHEVGKLVPEISCPKNERLQAELVNRKTLPLDKRGRRVIESKEAYKKRGFSSPDCADAFLLCFYEPVKGANIDTETINEQNEGMPDLESMKADW